MIRNGCRLWVMEIVPSATYSGPSHREAQWVPVDQRRPDAAHVDIGGPKAKVVTARPLTDREAERYLAGGLPLRDIHA